MKKSSSGRNDDPAEMSVENYVTRNRPCASLDRI